MFFSWTLAVMGKVGLGGNENRRFVKKHRARKDGRPIMVKGRSNSKGDKRSKIRLRTVYVESLKRDRKTRKQFSKRRRTRAVARVYRIVNDRPYLGARFNNSSEE